MEKVIIYIISWYILIPIGIFIPLFMLGIPAAYVLKNNPYKIRDDGVVEKSDFGYFTEIGTGTSKIIEFGGDFYEALLNRPGYNFAGLLKNPKEGKIIPKNNPKKFYEIVYSPEDEFNPLPRPSLFSWFDIFFISYKWLWFFWKLFIFKKTKLIYTGFWPFMKVKVIEMEYDKELPDIFREGKRVPVYTKVINYSDHFRSEPFDYLVVAGSIDTIDNIELEMIVVLIARVYNPWLAAYRADKGGWTNRINKHLPAVMNDYARQRPIDQIYTGKDEGLVVKLESLGKRKDTDTIEEDEKKPLFNVFGIEIIKANIKNRTPTDPKQKAQLGDLGLAGIDKKTKIIRAEGDAKSIDEVSESIRRNEYGVLAAQLRRDVEVVQRIPEGSSAIINIGGDKGKSESQETQDLLKALITVQQRQPKKK